MPRIVIIDDNAVVTAIYQNKLRHAGYTVDVAGDGESGLALVGEAGADLVLLDLMLPGLSGVEVLQRLRGSEEFRDLPVIVFSGSYSGEEIERARRAGATRVLAKGSVTPNQITETIRDVLEASKARPPAAAPLPAAPVAPPTGPLRSPTGPLRSPTGPLFAESSHAPAEQGGNRSDPASPKRVLVIEDEPRVMAVVRTILEREGFTTVPAVDGKEAYKILERDANFAAGIFDIMVPFIHGPEVVRYMRTEKRLMNIPVILTSGHATQRLDLDSFPGAAVKFLPKPFTPAQLQAVLRVLVAGGDEP